MLSFNGLRSNYNAVKIFKGPLIPEILNQLREVELISDARYRSHCRRVLCVLVEVQDGIWTVGCFERDCGVRCCVDSLFGHGQLIFLL
jgi:hypothetical protein